MVVGMWDSASAEYSFLICLAPRLENGANVAYVGQMDCDEELDPSQFRKDVLALLDEMTKTSFAR